MNKFYISFVFIIFVAYVNIQAMESDQEQGKKLLLAVHNNDMDTIKQLITSKKPAVINYQNPYDGTYPLYWAARKGSIDMVTLLLNAGADPNLQTKSGYTSLHTAAQRGHDNIVELLLIRRADPKITKKEKKTPSDIAKDDSIKKIFTEPPFVFIEVQDEAETTPDNPFAFMGIFDQPKKPVSDTPFIFIPIKEESDEANTSKIPTDKQKRKTNPTLMSKSYKEDSLS